jgi:NAD(P)-dependent dehydrogenase (short-subunit alcohol dehydrogenase family)
MSRIQCAAEGLEIEVGQLDVCDPDSVASALADAAELDVLINNASSTRM